MEIKVVKSPVSAPSNSSSAPRKKKRSARSEVITAERIYNHLRVPVLLICSFYIPFLFIPNWAKHHEPIQVAETANAASTIKSQVDDYKPKLTVPVRVLEQKADMSDVGLQAAGYQTSYKSAVDLLFHDRLSYNPKDYSLDYFGERARPRYASLGELTELDFHHWNIPRVPLEYSTIDRLGQDLTHSAQAKIDQWQYAWNAAVANAVNNMSSGINIELPDSIDPSELGSGAEEWMRDQVGYEAIQSWSDRTSRNFSYWSDEATKSATKQAVRTSDSLARSVGLTK